MDEDDCVLPSAQAEDEAAPELLDDLSPDLPVADIVGEELARIDGDALLREELAAQGFTGPGYDYFVEQIARFGYEIMRAWIARDYIFAQCRKYHLNLPYREIPPAEREDIVQEVVARALASFLERDIIGGGWKPELGASMKTYFTRKLCLQFANTWRQRLRGFPRDASVSLDEAGTDFEHAGPGPEELAIQRDEISRGLAMIPSKNAQVAIVLHADGYRYEEIGEIIATSSRAVEGYLRRHAQRRARKGDAR